MNDATTAPDTTVDLTQAYADTVVAQTTVVTVTPEASDTSIIDTSDWQVTGAPATEADAAVGLGPIVKIQNAGFSGATLDIPAELKALKGHVPTGDDLRLANTELLESMIAAAHPDVAVEKIMERDQAFLAEVGESPELEQLRRERNRLRRKNSKARSKERKKEANKKVDQVSEEKLEELAVHFNDRKPRPARAAALFLPADRAAAGVLSKILQRPVTNLSDDDGVSHINIAAQAETDLGRALDPYTRTVFTIKDLGRFESIAGFNCWILCGGKLDIFRSLAGEAVRKTIKHHFDDRIPQSEQRGIKVVQADAVYQMVMQKPALAQALKDSSLPFRNYFLFGEHKIRQDAMEARWLIPTIEAIRDALRDSTETEPVYPDFSFLEPRFPRRGSQ